MNTHPHCLLTSKPNQEFLLACMEAGLALGLTPHQVFTKGGLNLYSENVNLEWLQNQLIKIQFGWFEKGLVTGAGWEVKLA